MEGHGLHFPPTGTSENDLQTTAPLELSLSTTGFIDNADHTALSEGESATGPANASPKLWSHICAVCGVREGYRRDLTNHARREGHATFPCTVRGCGFLYSYAADYRKHLKAAHATRYTCDECAESFPILWGLEHHVRETGHGSFRCNQPECERVFSRVDTYQSHLLTHQEGAQRHPCKYCKKYRGLNGFKRKDHLIAHLRGYHNMEVEKRSSSWGASCYHRDCTPYFQNGGGRPFPIASDLNKHMKQEHDETFYPCPEIGCNRIDAKGYTRKIDLRKHLQKEHGIMNAEIKDFVWPRVGYGSSLNKA